MIFCLPGIHVYFWKIIIHWALYLSFFGIRKSKHFCPSSKTVNLSRMSSPYLEGNVPLGLFIRMAILWLSTIFHLPYSYLLFYQIGLDLNHVSCQSLFVISHYSSVFCWLTVRDSLGLAFINDTSIPFECSWTEMLCSSIPSVVSTNVTGAWQRYSPSSVPPKTAASVGFMSTRASLP